MCYLQAPPSLMHGLQYLRHKFFSLILSAWKSTASMELPGAGTRSTATTLPKPRNSHQNPPSRVWLARPSPPVVPAGRRLLPELLHPPQCARRQREVVVTHRTASLRCARPGQVRWQIRAELRLPPSPPPQRALLAMGTGPSHLAGARAMGTLRRRLLPAKP